MADRTVRVRLVADIASYRAGLQNASKATADFGRQLASGSRDAHRFLDDVGRVGLLAGGALTLGLGLAARATLGFDRQLSELAAVSGATADEMDRLRQAALDAGQATAFSASEAALAQTELAKAGISTADILGGALSGALDLAAAGGLNLGQAAEIAAQAMTTFGLSGRDVGRVADALAAGANKSVADVDTLAQALAQSGLVAEQMGLSLEETVGTLALFSQNALNGSDAGTSFKTALMRLSAPTAEARALMDELGLRVYDAAGQMLPFAEVAENVQTALSGLTAEQRNLAMQTIFGQDAIRAANILLDEGGDGIRRWTSEVSVSGFAAEVAGTRMDNLAGDLETLRGSIETALIEGGSNATGVLRDLTQQTTTLVTGFGAMPRTLQGVGMGLGAVSATGLTAVGAFGTLYPRIQATKAALDGLGAGGQFLSRNLGRMATGLGVAGVAVAGVSYLFGRQAEKQAEAQRVVEAYTQAILDQNGALLDNIDAVTARELAQADFATDLREAGANFDVLNEGIRSSQEALELLSSQFSVGQLGGEFARELEEAGLAGSELGDELIRLYEAMGGRASGTFNDFLAKMADLSGAYSQSTEDAANMQATTEGLEGASGEAAGALGELGGAAAQTGADFTEAREAIESYRESLRASFDPVDAMRQAIADQAGAQRELNEVLADGEATSEDVEAALWALQEANLAVDQAAVDLSAGLRDGSVNALQFRESLDRWVAMGAMTAEQAQTIYDRFVELGTAADALQPLTEMTVTADASQATAAIAQLRRDLQGLANTGRLVVSVPGVAIRRAEGGLVPDLGTGPGDTVPAMLTKGEYVIREPVVRALGVDALDRLNYGGLALASPGDYVLRADDAARIFDGVPA